MFKRLRQRPPAPKEMPVPTRFEGGPPAPERDLAIVGDLHGELDCLEVMIALLETRAPEAQWVFVGDYIDRGDQSAQVLERLRRLEEARPDTIFLRGNHEDMMLSFLDTPEETGNRWMRYGGLQTMASFGAFRLGEQNAPEALRVARDQLVELMPEGLGDWLAARPRWVQTGNVAVVHAGADPALPMDAQTDRSLTWGHRAFGRQAREDGVWVAHGHTIVDMPRERNGVISVDTGAYATGRLTAALVGSGMVEFVQAKAG